MLDQFLPQVFENSYFMPHGHCYLWRPDILAMHVGSDAIIGASYISISFAIFYFIKKKKGIHLQWIFLLFAGFIFACALIHLFDIYTTWRPNYFSEGLLKVFTALISATTAIILWPLMPKALNIPSPQELKNKNIELEELNKNLEKKVSERAKDSLRLASIVNSSADAILAKDLDGNITDWNKSAEKLYGYSHGEVIGKKYLTLIIKLISPSTRLN